MFHQLVKPAPSAQAAAQSRTDPNEVLVSLIGMPGGGKSTVGRHLARRLKVAFLDTDSVIEQRIGEPIRCFFEREGEAQFRDLEQEVLDHVASTFTGVLATGGGVVLRQANRLLLRELSTVLYLSTSPDAIGRRLRADTKRPLLQVSNPLQRLREMYAERDPLYQQTAHFVIATGRTSIATLLSTILMQLELAGVVDPYTVSSPIDPLPAFEMSGKIDSSSLLPPEEGGGDSSCRRHPISRTQ